MLDNNYYIETSEGIDIEVVPAGLAVRSIAFVIDLLIRAAIIFAVALLSFYLGAFGQGLLLITVFVVEWFYPVLFEISSGATPGKKAMGLKVVHENGLPVNFGASLSRNLFRFIDFLPVCYVLGGICLMLNQKCKRVGDIVAGTTVVYVNENDRSVNFSAQRYTGEMPKMTAQQQQLIISFANRAKGLSQARAKELANYLSPIIEENDDQAVKKIKAMAATLVGKQ